MARNRSAKARRQAKQKKKLYVLAHQRQLAEEQRKQYLLTLDEHDRAVIRSLEETAPACGMRAAFGAMMRRVFDYAPTPMPAEDIRFYRFESGVDCTDSVGEMLLRWHQAKALEKARV